MSAWKPYHICSQDTFIVFIGFFYSARVELKLYLNENLDETTKSDVFYKVIPNGQWNHWANPT